MPAQLISTDEVPSHLQATVEVRGHVQTMRKLGNLAFIVLRDIDGTAQVVVDDENLLELVNELGHEMPVSIVGEVVVHAGKGAQGCEIRAKQIVPLAKKNCTLPVEVSKDKAVDGLSVSTLLDYRPLTLRNEKVRSIFRIEAALCRGFREFLNSEKFTEIHSPKIVSTGTEGGAQLFALEYFGRTAYLAQSPQFYKQMMVGVFERVYEIGPVYRAEEHDTTRHLNEYISMDIEMGFIRSEEDLMAIETRLLKAMFESVQENCARELSLYGAELPKIGARIPAIKLAEACELLRSKYGWRKGDADSSDLDPEGERLLCEHFAKAEGSEMVFVTHYPWNVRPFYAMPEAGTTLSHSFDLLYRGLEITTGGQRIHEYEMLVERIRSRGLDPEKFEDYLQCFKYGMPPHGGFAIGLERLTKQLLGLNSVKQTALFPRDLNRLTP
jgi:nondiscriminating aspartyl-tRNA synthetase